MKQKRKVDKLARLIAMISLLVMLALFVYTFYNVQVLSTSPCEVCESLGRYCVPDLRMY